MGKKNFGRDLWTRACELVREPDGLPEYECGEWTIDKLYFLCNYLAQVSQAMVGHRKFDSINYVDLFAGSGVCRVKDTERRYAGSAALAGLCSKPYTSLFLVERDAPNLNALVTRLRRWGTKSELVPIKDDANRAVRELAARILPHSLTIAFVDPFSLDIEYEAIATLAKARPLDLLILFADDMDLIRNVEQYRRQPLSKLDRFLGPNSNWRVRYAELHNRDAPHLREMFAEIYVEQLRQIGYAHSAQLSIPRDGRPLYRLIYASKNELGLKFWRIAASHDRGGQREFGFDG